MKFTQQTLITLALGFAAFQLTEALPSYTTEGPSSYDWSKHYGNQDVHEYNPNHYGHRRQSHGSNSGEYVRGSDPLYNDYESMPSDYNDHHENDDDCDNEPEGGYGNGNDNIGDYESWASYKPLVKRAGEDRVAGVINNIFPGGNQGILETDSRKNFPAIKTKKKTPAKSDDSTAAEDKTSDSSVVAKSVEDDAPKPSALAKRSDDRPEETLDAVVALLNRITKSLARTTERRGTTLDVKETLEETEPVTEQPIEETQPETEQPIDEAEPALMKRGMLYDNNEMPEKYPSQPAEDCEEAAPSHHWEYYEGDDMNHEMPSDEHETPSEECEEEEEDQDHHAHWKKQNLAPMDSDYTKGWFKHGNYWQKIVRKVSEETGETTYYKIIKVIVPWKPHQDDETMTHYPTEWNNEGEDCEENDNYTFPSFEEGHSNKVYKKTSKVTQHHYEEESTEGYMQTTDGYGNMSSGNGDEETDCEDDSSQYPSEY